MNARVNGTCITFTKKAIFVPLGLEFVTWVTTYLHRHGQRRPSWKRTRQGEGGTLAGECPSECPSEWYMRHVHEKGHICTTWLRICHVGYNLST